MRTRCCRIRIPWPGGYRVLETGRLDGLSGPDSAGWWRVRTDGMEYVMDARGWVETCGRRWTAGEFGKLAMEIENIRLERALEGL